MEKENSMESATITINMVIRLMNVKRNQDLKKNVKNVTNKSSECKTKTLNPIEQIVKAIFGWDYKTWYKCHYCGEFGYIGV